MGQPIIEAIERTVGYLRHPHLPPGAVEVATSHLEALMALEHSHLQVPAPSFEDFVQEVAAPKGDGWIKWDGGTRPVAAGVKVQVRYRDCDTDDKAYPAERFRWHHSDGTGGSGAPDVDIIAYRVCAT